MSPEVENIITKVKKLLDLKHGAEKIGSLEEAANAAEKIQTLLLKHNLDMDLIEKSNPKKVSQYDKASFPEIYAQKNEGQWIYKLYHTISTFNFCQVVISRFWDKHGKKNGYIVLIGTKENVEVIRFLTDQLEYRIRLLEKEAWKLIPPFLHEKRNSFRRAYFEGAVLGIHAQLKEAKARAMRESEAVTALVVRHEDKLKEALSKLYPNIKNSRSSQTRKGSQGLGMGYQDGKDMQIHKGVSKNKPNPMLS